MRDLEIPDELWERIEPLLPVVPRRYRWPGRKRRSDRDALNGILFVLTHRDQLAAPAPAARVRLRGDLLPGGCATGPPPGCGTASMRSCWRSCTRPTRSTGRVRSPTPRTCAPKGGRGDRTKPGRPQPARVQAPPADRRGGHPAGGHLDRRQPQRHHPAHPLDRCDPAGARQARPPAAPAGVCAGGSRLRPPAAAAGAQGARDLAGDRPARGAARLRAGDVPVGGGTDACVAAPVQASGGALRVPSGHPLRVPQAGLLPDLLATLGTLILK